MPWLDIRNCHCNCSKYPERGTILQNLYTDVVDENVEEESSTHGFNLWEDADDYQYSDDEWYNSEVYSSSSNENEETSDVDDFMDVTHTLPFKVIGVAHSISTQNHLEKCLEKIHEHDDVQVRVSPEPDNEKDKDAISVQVNYGNDEWHHVGYIASELTRYVHNAMQSGILIECRIEHIKFRVHFYRPGYYMKLLLTIQGTWEPFVLNRSKRVR
jgi:hypothetical protein